MNREKQSYENTSPFHKSSRYWIEERWGGSLKLGNWEIHGRSLVFEYWDNFRGFINLKILPGQIPKKTGLENDKMSFSQ